jgi:hypothetical protein
MSEWQPIETAPKDGTHLLIFKHGWKFAPVARWTNGCGEDEPCGWIFDEFLSLGCDSGFVGWNEDIEDGNMPTHWQAIPSP